MAYIYDLDGNEISVGNGSTEITDGMMRLFRSVCVIGDSIASGTICYSNADGTDTAGEVRYEWSWLSILCRKYGFTGLNLARGGAAATDWADTFRNVWGSTETQDCYIIALGTNDLNDTLGDEDSTDTTTFGGAYNAIIAKIREKAPNAVMFCCSPYSSLDIYAYSEINRIIRQIAKNTDGVFYIDIHDKVKNTDEDPYKYWYLGHPNTIGNLALANVIESKIQTTMISNWDYFAKFGALQEGSSVNPLLGW